MSSIPLARTLDGKLVLLLLGGSRLIPIADGRSHSVSLERPSRACAMVEVVALLENSPSSTSTILLFVLLEHSTTRWMT